MSVMNEGRVINRVQRLLETEKQGRDGVCLEEHDGLIVMPISHDKLVWEQSSDVNSPVCYIRGLAQEC